MEDLIYNSNGSVFFEKLETYFETPIPTSVKKILLINDYDCVIVLKDCDEDSLTDIQEYLRNVFDDSMLVGEETRNDFLGRFANCQQKFEFTSGQKKWIKIIVKKCKDIYDTRSTCSVTVQDIANVEKKGLFKLIGSQILTVFNDAKRITLSAWSWPSRVVANQLSSHFKEHGTNYHNVEPPIDLLYVTPSHYNDLLNSIVTVDMQQLQCRLRNSLAMSFRVDGSVDRTQKHNIHALVHVAHNDGTLSTYFLGFDIPDGSKADAYFEVSKRIANKILPWNEFIALITSIVTDGEGLNTGHITGLWTQLLNEKRIATPNMPLIQTWCIGHRTNLAWKDMLFMTIISELLQDAGSISTHFHQSGERTRKLIAAASTNNFDTPLRYPQVFEVRWTEYTYGLLYAVLRNWRVSVTYFISEKLEGFSNRWLCYDKLHLATFICDILRLLKSFQKHFQGDSTSIVDIPSKRNRLFERLNNLQNGTLENGWEELFLKEAVHENGKIFLHGHELKKSTGRTRQAGSTSKFTTDYRNSIIQTLIANLTERLDLDREIQLQLNPLLEIQPGIQRDLLEKCHSCIIPDLRVDDFVSEYHSASNLLSDDERKNPLQSIVKLEENTSHRFQTLKIAVARTAVMKPHSADVERMINIYNKYKDTDRTLISPTTLFNNIYIHTNMCSLTEYNPIPAIEHWLSAKNRKPRHGTKAKEQEWHKGVFPDTANKERSHSEIIKF